ncbi:MAG: TPM domain-containing protein [Lachnospiraceae bacterium]|nr:TPM domain-containing protein [Lachnospiraceae bacterium]
MHKRLKAITALLLLISSLAFSLTAYAEPDKDASPSELIIWENTETGYFVLLQDEAELLDAEEEAQLSNEMKGITSYGNAVFKTISYNSYSASSYAEDFYDDIFGQSSGTFFLIDMDNRELYLFNNGDISYTITSAYSDSITDNVYRYASKEDYYSCASKTFEQVQTLLAGRRIAQPMKYISNALLALILAALINYFVAMRTASSAKASSREVLNSISTQFTFTNPQKKLTKQDKVYIPPSSGSSGGRSNSGGRSHSGGGHRV